MKLPGFSQMHCIYRGQRRTIMWCCIKGLSTMTGQMYEDG
ncbi:hypothetical protein SELSPUOL_01508 [Selenomonas sputigena ATCC 35185]|uniref:Uncharacterized protein n=1 Tax=Selenomonas sputigena (strain ATCC 35185 / DSM 20758 / CCUG 44933 / VPI D19B-28) TaxID=546271 RepID=C9LVL4_SELS3|nr:hypothetical protein SELSPUOL_01508 [Selenomonas sputigena ATCC 35185]